jgi:hypothetical protein
LKVFKKNSTKEQMSSRKRILAAPHTQPLDRIPFGSLTTTMPMIQATIEVLKAADLRDQAKVIISGAPLMETYAQ